MKNYKFEMKSKITATIKLYEIPTQNKAQPAQCIYIPICFKIHAKKICVDKAETLKM